MSTLTLLQAATASENSRPDSILRELVQSELVQLALDEVESSSSLLDNLSKNSYWHSTGIFKLVLWKPQGNTPEVRLHIWSERSRTFSATHVDSIHNHRWNFASKILSGTFRKELFTTENTDLNDHQHFRFESQGRGQPNKVTHIADVSVNTSFDTTIECGGQYYLNSRILHRLTPITKELSATLFVCSPNLFAHSDVLFSPGSRKQNSEPPAAPKLDPTLIVSLLTDLRVELNRT